jgi:nicotinate-nucleotide--dimethylbenzimidazole phosphoribosyltransferase
MKNELSLRFGDAAPQAERLIRKLNLPLKNHPKTNDPVTLIGLYGSTELAMITGAILKAASLKMAVVLDGVTPILASRLSSLIHENSLDYCFFVEDKADSTSQLLNYSDAAPILSNVKSGQQDGTNGIIALNSLIQYCDLCL